VEGALVHEVKARLISMEESEFGSGGELVEGAGDAGKVAIGGIGVELASLL